MKRYLALLLCLLLFSLPITSLAMNEGGQVTRAQFIKDVLVASDSDIEEVIESSFVDVMDPQYIPYIEAAYARGIISGYGELFKPMDTITKEQAIIVIVKVFGERTSVKELTEEDINTTLTFLDNESISSWAKPYIAYAIKNNLYKVEGNSLNPKMPLSEGEASKLISDAKNTYEKLFTRNGLSASDMLVVANEKTEQYETYKQKGSMKMNMKMEIKGIPEEKMQDNPGMDKFLDEGINMNIDIDVQIKNPNQAYIKEIITGNEGQKEMNQEIEIFMDDKTMYTKTQENDKWVTQDIGSIMKEMQSYSNNDPYRMSQLSDDQLKFFKDYARFEDEVRIDNKEYYVVGIDISKEVFDKYYKELMEKSMNASIEMQANNPDFQKDPSFNQDQFKQMMEQLIKQMNIEVNYDFYINKETMIYEKMGITQDVYISMDQFLAMMQAFAKEGEEVPEMSMTMITHTDGIFDLYDFNGEVNFPEITPEDIMDPQQSLQMNSPKQ